MRKIIGLIGTVSLLALAAPAVAQQSAPAPAAGGGSGIGEIIVTAQRREESLQKAAIAIDAVKGTDLAKRGITSATDITKAVPALSMPAPGGDVASIFIRGVGNITTSNWTDPAVAPSYDGVVLGRGGGVFGASFYDLSRVEVLKGPQGILYGRNATGGAVNVLPARPQLGSNGMGINLSYGNYHAINVDAYVNLATSQNSALRIAGSYDKHDGYNRDGTDDSLRGGLRAQWLIEPSSDLSIRIGGDYTHIGGKGVGGSYIGNYISDGTNYNFTPSGLDSSEGFNTPAANAYRTSQLGAPGFGFFQAMTTQPSQNMTYWGLNAEIGWQTGLGKVTVIPAYRESKNYIVQNGPAFNSGVTNERVGQASLEARISGKRGLFDYVLGGFYYNEKINAANIYNQEFVLPIQHYRQTTQSWAAFGQLTAHVTDRFRLIGGARYTSDHKAMNGMINNFITFCGSSSALITPPASFAQGCANSGAAGLPRYPNLNNTGDVINWLKSNGWIASSATDQVGYQVFNLTNGVGQILKTYNPVIDSGTYSRITWKASAEYDVGPHNLLYATVETGYRAGGFQLTESKTRYNPEYITAYSLGSKNRFLDNHVQLNLEAFLWKYKDQQITYFTVDSSGTLINSSENAGRSTIWGVDADVIVKPAHGTTLTAKAQYLNTRYDDLHLYTASPRDNIACPYTYTGGTAGGAPVKDFNCSGKPLLFSPAWTLNLGAEQVVPLSDTLELVGNVDTAWRDSQWGAFEYLSFEHIPAYWNTDVSLTLRKAQGGWSVSGYIHNLENQRQDLAPQSSPLGFAVGHYSAPRTYGLRLSATF